MTTLTATTESIASIDSAPHALSGLLPRGHVLGRYELLFHIATGGMATVYAARLIGAGRFQKPVAIKVMLPHLSREPRFVAMFMDEAQLSSHVQSPHVVPVLELARHDDETLFMALELVVGVSLKELFEASEARARPLPVAVAGALIAQVAEGLHAAHVARAPGGEPLGIVHRDVSPHNVLVGVDGRARLTDFGVARGATRLGETQTGELKGKLPYFSPEQIRCEELDGRSDVFSLGIVAWELFAGTRLFDAPHPLATVQAVASRPVARLDALRPDVPRAVADAVERALERDRARRTPTALAFALELRAALAGSALADADALGDAVRALCGPRVARIEEVLARTLAAPPRAEPRSLAPRRTAARTRWMAALAGVVLVSLVVWGAARLRGSDVVNPPALAAPNLSAARDVAKAVALPAPAREPVAFDRDAGQATPREEPEALALDTPAEPEARASRPPKARERPRRTKARPRRAAESAKPAPAPAAPARRSVLAPLDQFDRERTR